MESLSAIAGTGVLQHVQNMNGQKKRTALLSDGAACYPGLAAEMGVKHFACCHRRAEFVKKVRYARKQLEVHTGTIDNVWRMVKAAVPDQLRTCSHKKNHVLQGLAACEGVALGKYHGG